jgi:hypothetical protein
MVGFVEFLVGGALAGLLFARLTEALSTGNTTAAAAAVFLLYIVYKAFFNEEEE